jgi:hypothetical protein
MKKYIILLAFLLSNQLLAQIAIPSVSDGPRPVSNPDMLIQLNGQKIEVLPNLRAIKQGNSYSIISTDSADVLTSEKLGVAYSYARRGNIPLTGEISFKTRASFNAGSLGSISSKIKILIAPNVYIFNVNTPVELVSALKILQNNNGVEWVEPFVPPLKIN